jgi:uracil-DNA glycosylase
MKNTEDKMRELLYDFRRYFEQLKDDGVSMVETTHQPYAGENPAPRKRPSADSRHPQPVTKSVPVSPSKRIEKIQRHDGRAVSPGTKSFSSAERFRGLIERINNCRNCGLAATRNCAVPGEGGSALRILFVGEGPGAEEDRTGRPFVGRSGQLLDKILAAVSLTRKDIFITNIVKCRPPGNRDPLSEEVIACWPYLDEQIKILRPRVIVTLGAPAAKTLLDTATGIGRLRGRFHDYHGIPLLPTYHPAYLLRSYTLENRKKVWEDMKMLREFIKG